MAAAPPIEGPAVPQPTRGYANYVLTLLVIVYILNFIDRQILAILAEDIKRDLGLSDADIGFLYGTAFGVFYSLFGIPLGRLADSWNRVKLLSAGLAIWSAATAASAFARTGGMLTGARIGVGIGEATASPCAYSLISDYFPKEKRATALAIYSSGIFIGGGLSLFIGGEIVERWNLAYPGGGPLGLAGWQAAFLAVGIPGLLLAIWTATLREPLRGQADGIITPPNSRPFRGFFEELLTVIPPFTLIGASRRGVAALAINLLAAASIAFLVHILVTNTGGWSSTTARNQWVAVGLGVYAVFSWATALRRRDPPTFQMIWGTPAFLCAVVGYGLIAFLAYPTSFWSVPYAERLLGVGKAEAGLILGSIGAGGGFLGVVFGGRLADFLRRSNPSGRVIVMLIGLLVPIIPMVIGFTTRNEVLFYIMTLIAQVTSSMALGAAAATTQDLVLPRMRGAATATFFLGTTLIGLALGPYLAGYLSQAFGDLGYGVIALLAVVPISLAALLYLYRALPAAEASRLDRARAAGETI
ncbi:MAG TPA: MFS transporter [Allosphingosinicella sp.]|nr:MFS transporter [Allosphingosinicella sp.]